MFRRSGAIVPDGNGTFACLGRSSRSGRSPVDDPAFVYSGEWNEGVRMGLGVTSFHNGDEFRGRYQGDVRNGHGEMKWKKLKGRLNSCIQPRHF